MHAPLTSPFRPPAIIDRPFAPPIENILDLPPPPSVNRTRRVDWAGSNKVRDWCKAADGEIYAAGGMRKFVHLSGQFEATLILDETLNSIDLDNGIKAVIDYARRIGLVVDDSPKFMRRVIIEWGRAPSGCRLILRSIAGVE